MRGTREPSETREVPMTPTDAPTPTIRTVLCPVDFSTLSDRELAVAVELCETFGARLVLHHNRDLAPPAWTRAWEWEQTHALAEDVEARADQHMNELLARIPKSVAAEAVISRGLVVPVLLHLVDQLPADLLVLGSHGWATEEHASVADRIIESCPCPVLTIRDCQGEAPCLRLRPADGGVPVLLVPTDFSDSGDRAVRYAFDLARQLSVRLHLLHVAPKDDAGKLEASRGRLAAMVPADLAGRVDSSVETGRVTDALVASALRLEPGVIVMGRHARGVVRRFFTHDHAQDMLHRARCPVWFAA